MIFPIASLIEFFNLQIPSLGPVNFYLLWYPLQMLRLVVHEGLRSSTRKKIEGHICNTFIFVLDPSPQNFAELIP